MPWGETGMILPASSPTPSQSSTARRATDLAMASAISSWVAPTESVSTARSARADTISAVVSGPTSRRRPGARSSHSGVAVRFSRIMINILQGC